MDLENSMIISAAGLRAQTVRMRVIAENIANSDSLPEAPGLAPYRRKLVTFKNALDRELGVEQVKANRVTYDDSDFGRKHMPGHPAADVDGYVLTPNVDGLIEAMDMREAQRTYQANLNAMQNTRDMAARTLDLLR